MRRYVLFILIIVAACTGNKHAEEDPIARVFDEYLYPSDLILNIPSDLNAEDSTALAKDIINIRI